MKDGEKTYFTSQIAGIVGLHPNTVRKYEEWGLLQTPERKPNGYRVYTDVHMQNRTTTLDYETKCRQFYILTLSVTYYRKGDD